MLHNHHPKPQEKPLMKVSSKSPTCIYTRAHFTLSKMPQQREGKSQLSPHHPI